MSTNYHTPIPNSPEQEAKASLFNSRFSGLDAGISDAMSFAYNNNTELVAARSPYQSLKDRLDAMTGGYVGGNIASLTNGTAEAGQKTVTLDATTGFLAGGWVVYTLVGGAIEYNLIAAVTDATHLLLTTNIGTGGIGDNIYVGMVPVDIYQAANAIPHAGSLTLPQTIEYINNGAYNAAAYGASASASAATNTAAIQATIDDAFAAGSPIVILPPGILTINATLIINTMVGIRLTGGGGMSYADPGSGRGTTLKWVGGTSDDMLYIFNSQDIQLDHINFDGNNTPGSRAILVDSNNTIASKRISIDHIGIRRCATGIQFGTVAGSGTQYQVDSNYVSNCKITEMYGAGSTCIQIQSQNVDMTTFDNCELTYAYYGLKVVRGGILRMTNVSGGGTAEMEFITIAGPYHSLSFRECQAEGIAYFLHVTSTAPSSIAPIHLIGCSVDSPVSLDITARIMSVSCFFQADVTLAGDDCEWASWMDTWTSPYTFVKSGTNDRTFILDGTSGLNLNGSYIKSYNSATYTWDPGSLATGAVTSEAFSFPGAVTGDILAVSLSSLINSEMFLTATVAGTGTIYVSLFNPSGITRDLASGTLRISVWKH